MRRTAAVLVLSLMLPAAALAAPNKLKVAQLDMISAGVSATVDASARALGSGFTDTKAQTRAFGGKFVDIAIGRGKALAAGTDAAETDVDVGGEGTIVRGVSHTVSRNGAKGAISKSWGVVIAVEINFDAIHALRASAPR